MDTNTVLEMIRKRRTIRRFTDQAVSDDEVKQLLLAAMAAPSIMDRRPWHFIVIRDAATKKLIAETLRMHRYIEEAPALIAAVADLSASPAWRLDMSAAVENLHLAAVGLGLGSAWIGAPDWSLLEQTEEKLREAVGLPDDAKLFAFIAVGHPAEQRPAHELDPYFVSTRVHYDKWDELKYRGL